MAELRFPRVRPVIVNGRLHMCRTIGEGIAYIRPFRWWSPIDWVRDGWDWWRVRRHF